MELCSLIGRPSDDYEIAFRELAEADNVYDAKVGSMMLELLERLRRDSSTVTLFAFSQSPAELSLLYASSSKASAHVTVRIDRPDYAPLVDGKPPFHYRMSFVIQTTDDSTFGERPFEKRVQAVEDACEFLNEAILEANRHS